MVLYRYKLVVSYDGTNYAGWQAQPDGNGIVQIMGASFGRAFGTDARLTGASRTDAGVHSLGQTVLLETPLELEPDVLMRVWNDALPPSVVIRLCTWADEGFHPRRNVISKTYWYHFFTERPLPFAVRYGWYCRRPIDLDTLQTVLDGFVGTHDFRALCKIRDVRGTTVRSISSIDLEFVEQFGAYRISVTGHSFMRHMVRRVVGAALAVATRQDMPAGYPIEVLRAGDPNNTLPKAPAHGLLLYKIRYQE